MYVNYILGTATAFHTGVKTRIGSIGVDGRGVDCKTSLHSKLETVLKWAHFAGKSTGKTFHLKGPNSKVNRILSMRVYFKVSLQRLE